MTAEKGKVVLIDYTLKDDDGVVIDTSVGSEPLKYLQGMGYLLPKLEEAIEGKGANDSFSLVLEPKDGYGEYDESKVIDVPRTDFDPDLQIEPGMQFQAMGPMGPEIVTVMEVGKDTVKINGNHELAGKTLHFDIKIVAVRDPLPDEFSPKGGCGGGCGGCSGCGSSDGESCGDGGCGGCCN